MAVEQRVNWKRARSLAVKVEESHVRYVASAYVVSDIKLCCRLFCFPYTNAEQSIEKPIMFSSHVYTVNHPKAGPREQ